MAKGLRGLQNGDMTQMTLKAGEKDEKMASRCFKSQGALHPNARRRLGTAHLTRSHWNHH